MHTLFGRADQDTMELVLAHMTKELGSNGMLAYLERSIPFGVFQLIKRHKNVSEDRYKIVAQVLEKTLEPHMDVSIPCRFLDVGRRFFKREEKQALLDFSIEERRLFCRELSFETI